MSQIQSPYQIAGTLNMQPSGNPLLGAAGGLGGLAEQYGQSYDAALQTNQQNYNNILSGYQGVMGNLQQGLSAVGNGYGSLMSGITNTLGADYGVPGANNQWGVAAPAAAAINALYASQTGQQFDQNGNPIGKPTGGSLQQGLINSGLGNSTASQNAIRGATSQYGTAMGGLGAQLAQTYAGYQSGIGQAYLGQQNQENLALANQGNQQLGFMNSVQAPYPQASTYAQLYQQQGAAQQFAAQQAQQLSIYHQGLGRSGSSGLGGGGKVGAAPVGGTYGSGGGGFASGSGVAPTNYGSPGASTLGTSYNQTSLINPVTPDSNGQTGAFGWAGLNPYGSADTPPNVGDTSGTEAAGAGIEY